MHTSSARTAGARSMIADARLFSVNGFSLMEVLIVVAITGIVGAGLVAMIAYFYQTNSVVLGQADAVAAARGGVEHALRDLREATYGEDGAYPIGTFATSSITFYADLDHDQPVERIRYVLEGTELARYILQPSGNPPSYTGSESRATIARYIRNASFGTPIFRYYGVTGAELATASSSLDIAQITTTLIVNVQLNRPNDEYTLTGSASLRNLRTE